MGEQNLAPRRIRRARERQLTRVLPHGRAAARVADAGAARAQRIRAALFGLVALAVLGAGGFLAFGDFLRRPGPSVPDAISIQSSMAGLTPADIVVVAGTTATLDWWTDDSALHLEGGVHTLVAPELGLHEELAAESSRQISWQVPDRPGTYDVFCDSCCGGAENPTMHGRIVIEEATA